MKHKFKRKHIQGIAAAVVLIAVAAVLVTKTYPAVVIGTGYISAAYWEQRQKIAQKFDSQAVKSEIGDQLVKIKKEQQLVSSLKVKTDISMQDELNFYKTGKNVEYKKLVDNYFFGSENLFVEYALKPIVYDALLRIKYNSDLKANSHSHQRAKDILSQVQNGQSFEELAKTESDDKITGQLGGDLGFVQAGQILPELGKVINDGSTGKVIDSVVISRLGYHVLFPVETADQNGTKVWHVKHILIKTSGFESWLSQMLDRFWVWRLK
jgi:parvulin-like peptidyl-prolyl isomerase